MWLNPFRRSRHWAVTLIIKLLVLSPLSIAHQFERDVNEVT